MMNKDGRASGERPAKDMIELRIKMLEKEQEKLRKEQAELKEKNDKLCEAWGSK